LRYFGPIGRHPGHVFLVCGRASRRPRPYTTYDEDWRWQRYLYCAHLLAAGNNTRWKHHAGFRAVPNQRARRRARCVLRRAPRHRIGPWRLHGRRRVLPAGVRAGSGSGGSC
jgi:hypothetical protein